VACGVERGRNPFEVGYWCDATQGSAFLATLDGLNVGIEDYRTNPTREGPRAWLHLNAFSAFDNHRALLNIAL
jgi:hypothetical protein